VMPWLARLTEAADGRGLELLFAACQLAVLAALAAFLLRPSRFFPAVIAVSALALPSGINLVIYALGSLDAGVTTGNEGFWLGMTLATGIALSIAVLWFQLLAELVRWWPRMMAMFIALMAARQSSELFKILEQMDWIGTGPPLWNTAALLPERSELGIFLHALVGYEASPSPAQCVVWLMTMVVLWLLAKRKGGAT
jgi:high-affinity iron transporter